MDAIVCGDKTTNLNLQVPSLSFFVGFGLFLVVTATKYLLWLILSQLAVVFSEETKLHRIADDQRGATRINS